MVFIDSYDDMIDSLIYIHGHISVCINNKPTINVKSIQLLIKYLVEY